MVVRLGFAIIAAVRPALLITDEVLAVGDESFQKKCIRWIESYLADGGTLLLVSHSMYHVQKLCKHALWLRDGEVEAYGEVFEVTQNYLAFHERKSAREQQAGRPRGGGELFEVTRALLDGDGGEAAHVMPKPGRLEVEVDLFTPDEQVPHLCLGIERADGTAVFNTTSEIDHAVAARIDAQHIRYRLELDLSTLLPGHYMIHLHPMDAEAIRLFSPLSRSLVIRGQSLQYGLLDLPRRWDP
jgi:lipopolysaccharide transport system ATP-binding protein